MASVSLIAPPAARSGDMVQMLDDMRRVEPLPNDRLRFCLFERASDYLDFQKQLLAEIAANYGIPYELLQGKF